ncbi:CDP-alcohol phosphatidyltransferase [uncultured archaeon]|nr:CDP-alcohol phosphatidyltransferase [uncultured archaeon]
MLGKFFRKIENYVGKRYLRRLPRLAPNIISFATLIPAAGSIYFIINKLYLLSALMISLSLLLDVIDGSIARNQKMMTKFGAYFDPMMDRFAEALIYFGLFLSGFQLESFLAIVGILLMGTAKSWAFMIISIGNFDWPAIGDRSERYMVLLIALGIAHFKAFIFERPVISLALWIIIVLVYFGTIQRIFFAKSLIEKYGKRGAK